MMQLTDYICPTCGHDAKYWHWMVYGRFPKFKNPPSVAELARTHQLLHQPFVLRFNAIIEAPTLTQFRELIAAINTRRSLAEVEG